MISECDFQNNSATTGSGAAVRSYGTQSQGTSAYLERSVIDQSHYDADNAFGCDVIFESCKCAGADASQFLNSAGAGLCFVAVIGASDDSCDGLFSSLTNWPDVIHAFNPEDIEFRTGLSDDRNSNLDDPVGFAAGIDTAVSVMNCTFINHTCTLQSSISPFVGGAGLSLQSVTLSLLTSLTFKGNTAKQGAGLHLKACENTILWDSSFTNNHATHEGGAVASVDTGEAGLLIGRTNITHCSALLGGAIYWGPATNTTVGQGSRLINNTAVTSGGAVYCNGCQSCMLINSVEVAWNSVTSETGSGGGGYFDQCLGVTLDGISLHDNR